MVKASIDWGSSTFRAYRFDDNSAIAEVITRPLGIKNINSTGNSPDRFESALFNEIGHWLEPGDTVLLSGMITSVNGWYETAYLECPADVSALSARTVTLTCRGVALHFLPGVCQQTPYCDVMRGEELQLLGACDRSGTEIAVMPGTHSKWATIEDGKIHSFRTIPTGELYQVLLTRTLIGQLADDHNCTDHFIEGVTLGYKTTQIISELFSCRANVLMSKLPAGGVPSYLSGLLIGNEIKEGTVQHDAPAITLIGDLSLCDRYQSAMEHVGLTVPNKIVDAAAAGFSRLTTYYNSRQGS